MDRAPDSAKALLFHASRRCWFLKNIATNADGTTSLIRTKSGFNSRRPNSTTMGRGVEDAHVTRFVTFVVARSLTWSAPARRSPPTQRHVDHDEVRNWPSTQSVHKEDFVREQQLVIAVTRLRQRCATQSEGSVEPEHSREDNQQMQMGLHGRALAKARGPEFDTRWSGNRP